MIRLYVQDIACLNQNALLGNHQGKSCPITDLKRPTEFQGVKAPRFLDNRHMKVVGCQRLPPGISWYSPLEAESAPGHMDLSDATGKIPATPGIDPGTFRLVAQCLNHYATPGPNHQRSA